MNQSFISPFPTIQNSYSFQQVETILHFFDIVETFLDKMLSDSDIGSGWPTFRLHFFYAHDNTTFFQQWI